MVSQSSPFIQVHLTLTGSLHHFDLHVEMLETYMHEMRTCVAMRQLACWLCCHSKVCCSATALCGSTFAAAQYPMCCSAAHLLVSTTAFLRGDSMICSIYSSSLLCMPSSGWVRTDMGNAAQEFGSKNAPPLDVLTSVAGQQKVIMGLSQKQNGMFLNWDGTKLDW